MCCGASADVAEEDYKLLDDTMRNLETLAHSPEELRWRLSLVQAIKDLRREQQLTRTELRARFDKLEKGAVTPIQVARVVKTEIEDNADLAKVAQDVKRLWAGAMWLVVLIVGGCLGAVLKATVFK